MTQRIDQEHKPSKPDGHLDSFGTISKAVAPATTGPQQSIHITSEPMPEFAPKNSLNLELKLEEDLNSLKNLHISKTRLILNELAYFTIIKMQLSYIMAQTDIKWLDRIQTENMQPLKETLSSLNNKIQLINRLNGMVEIILNPSTPPDMKNRISQQYTQKEEVHKKTIRELISIIYIPSDYISPGAHSNNANGICKNIETHINELIAKLRDNLTQNNKQNDASVKLYNEIHQMIDEAIQTKYIQFENLDTDEEIIKAREKIENALPEDKKYAGKEASIIRYILNTGPKGINWRYNYERLYDHAEKLEAIDLTLTEEVKKNSKQPAKIQTHNSDKNSKIAASHNPQPSSLGKHIGAAIGMTIGLILFFATPFGQALGAYLFFKSSLLLATLAFAGAATAAEVVGAIVGALFGHAADKRYDNAHKNDVKRIQIPTEKPLPQRKSVIEPEISSAVNESKTVCETSHTSTANIIASTDNALIRSNSSSVVLPHTVEATNKANGSNASSNLQSHGAFSHPSRSHLSSAIQPADNSPIMPSQRNGS